MGFLLFILGLLLPLAIVGGAETVFYIIDLINHRRQIRRIKFAQKLADAAFAQAIRECKEESPVEEENEENATEE